MRESECTGRNMYIHTHISIHTPICVCVYVCVRVCARVCVYWRACECVHRTAQPHSLGSYARCREAPPYTRAQSDASCCWPWSSPAGAMLQAEHRPISPSSPWISLAAGLQAGTLFIQAGKTRRVGRLFGYDKRPATTFMQESQS